jgi:tRNA-dihydrouridine synthase A
MAVMHPASHRLCTAPMMDWSDRHCRYFFRQLAPHARLYTEMVTTGALLHGDVERHLRFDRAEHPVVLQLGGSEPEDLARCARLGAQWGYDEINLNCGCPSQRVQRGAFGACLMSEPALVAQCVRAMREACGLTVSVKHRLGVDRIEDYAFVRTFVEALMQAGCTLFIVHARNAILKGLSPKENREVPPLRYAHVQRLKRDFPGLTIVLNGGLHSDDEIDRQLGAVDGVMLGRAAYHDPWFLAHTHARLWNEALPSRAEVTERMLRYAQVEVRAGTPLRAITRHLLGLYHGQPRARLWRRMLSDAGALARNDPTLLLQARDAVERQALAA